jgi:alpha-amylase
MMENNLAILQFFHWYYPNDGSLYTFLTEQAAHLADLGFSMVWLPPSSKTEDGINGVGYSPYDLFDLGEFDQKGTVRTKYGDKKQLDEAIQAAHKHGIKVLFDAAIG